MGHAMFNCIDDYLGEELNLERVTCLYNSSDYQIFWLGIDNETAFRCNVYLIKSGDEALIIDPGSREFFEKVKQRALEVVSLENIKGLILCHQDPDVSASMIDWLDLKDDLIIYSSDRTNVLLPHYGREDYTYVSINNLKTFTFKTGHELEFIEAPFLHFSGAFTTYDKTSKYLFSGDIWAALDIEWTLVVQDFEQHISNMNLFHIDYMASNIAARGFVEKIDKKEIEAILPQHGSIINRNYVRDAIEYLRELKCGTDIIYGELSAR
jgi:flavorubredoxin